jgi:hypothetical protein
VSDYNRQTGRTTRMLWQALLAASSRPMQRVVVVVHTANFRYWVFDRLCMLCPLYPNAKARAGDFCLTLPNDSTIEVCSMEEPAKQFGRDRLFVDHFVEEQRAERASVYIDGIEHLEKPRGKSPGMETYEAAKSIRAAWDRLGEYLAGNPHLAAKPPVIGAVTMADIDKVRERCAYALEAVRTLRAEAERTKGSCMKPMWVGFDLQYWQDELARNEDEVARLLWRYHHPLASSPGAPTGEETP